MKKAGKTLWILSGLGAATGAAVLFTRELYRHSFMRDGSPLISPLYERISGPGHEPAYYEKRDRLKEEIRTLPQFRLKMPSARGEKLAGFYFPCEGSDGSRVAFLVHGYRSEHAETAGMYVDFYHRHGFDVFAPDNTAHGESAGRFIGFDLFESEDCLRWIEFLKQRAGKPVRIILHGFSLGGATVMKMSSRVPEEVRFIVEDSGYTEACTLLRKSPLFPQLKAIHKRLTGLDLKDTDVRPDLERAHVPILFVQGTKDRLVPAENGPYLYEYYQGPKDCFFVPGARHIESMYVDPDGYAKKLEEMIGKYC